MTTVTSMRLILIVILALMLGAMALFGWQVLEQERQLFIYQPVEATIIEGHVNGERDPSGSFNYTPVLRYRFELAGADHVSIRFSSEPMTGSLEWARGVVAEYPPGSTTTAYADPRQPADSFVVLSWSWSPWLGFGMALLGSVVVAVWLARR